MALKKKLEHASGATAVYWTVGEITVNFVQKAAKVVMVGYIDEEQRKAGKQPLDAREIQMGPEAFDQFFNKDDAPLKGAYEVAKQASPQGGVPIFEGAEDC